MIYYSKAGDIGGTKIWCNAKIFKLPEKTRYLDNWFQLQLSSDIYL